MKKYKSADDFFSDQQQWRAELRRLREIVLSTSLKEELKWGVPCYTHAGKNVVGIGAFKSYFGLWFHQGALLADDKGTLVNAQEGKTKALRQWRMQSATDIKPSIIKRYLKEAVANVDLGKEIKADRDKPIDMPAELSKAMRKHKGATAAFRELRRGLQREYAEYISDAKRDDTKLRRIEKILPKIVAGGGLNDKYRR